MKFGKVAHVVVCQTGEYEFKETRVICVFASEADAIDAAKRMDAEADQASAEFREWLKANRNPGGYGGPVFKAWLAARGEKHSAVVSGMIDNQLTVSNLEDGAIYLVCPAAVGMPSR